MSKFQKDYIITMKDIVREGHDILRKVTEPVQLPLSEEDIAELTCMMQYLLNSQDAVLSKKYQLRSGVGLSANQIGIDKCMFVAHFMDEKNQQHTYHLVNPKIISHSMNMIYLPEGEGCLSIDRDIKGYVPRYARIKVKAYDIEGKEQVLTFKGYAAIVMQHEIDHLNGKLFFDHINKANPFQLPENVDIESVWK